MSDEKKYEDYHAELEDAYYNGKPFRDQGVLTKEEFDDLHGYNWLKLDEERHNKGESHRATIENRGELNGIMRQKEAKMKKKWRLK